MTRKKKTRSKRQTLKAPVVGVINSSDDLVQTLSRHLALDGYAVVTLHVDEIKSGQQDFMAWLERHAPSVVIYDISVPYDNNWTFLKLIRELPACQKVSFVVTTVNKRALEAQVGPTDTIEIKGGHADDIEPTIDAVRKALKMDVGDEDRLMAKRNVHAVKMKEID